MDLRKKGISVLIVEDCNSYARVLAGYLEDYQDPVEVTGVNSAEDAIHRLKGDSFDICLLDIDHPGMNGVDLFRHIRTHGDNLPVVIITSEGDEKKAVDAVSLGAFDYLLKEEIDVKCFNRTIYYAIEDCRIRKERKSMQDNTRRLEDIVRQRTSELEHLNSYKELILENLGEYVRVVDPDNKVIQYESLKIRRDFGDSAGDACYCFWKRKEECEDCTSKKAIDDWYEKVKEETIGERVYSVTSIPIKNMDFSFSAIEVIRDITERKQSEKAMQALIEGTASKLGQEFFSGVVKCLCEWLDADLAIAGELDGDDSIKVLAMQFDGKIFGEYTYYLAGTPCDTLSKKGFCVYPERVSRLFAEDVELVNMGAEGYVGIPLKNKAGNLIGVLCAISRRRLNLPSNTKEIFEILASKAAAEIERKRAEEDALKSRERLEHIITTSPAVIYSCRIEGQRFVPTYTSANIETMLGYSISETAGDAGWWSSNIYPDDRAHILAEFHRNVLEHHDDSFSHEYRFRAKNGDYRWMRDSMRIIRDGQGKPLEIVGSWLDINESKVAEEEVKQKRRLAAMGEMSAHLAHEIRNPLTKIGINYHILLESSEISVDDRRSLEHLGEGLEELLSISLDLLDYSRGDKLYLQPLDMSKTICLSISECGNQIEEKNIKVVEKLTKGTLTVNADEVKIKRVLINIITNAVQSMQDGGTLIVSMKELGGKLVIAVSDNGCGIQKGNLDKIFTPFFTTKNKGTGLGMSIVRRFIDLHGGDIDVESDTGKGTTVTVSLPIR